MEIGELPDDELIAQAREWRLRALRGEKDARGWAHELEREVRRRARLQPSHDGALLQAAASVPSRDEPTRPAWRFW